MRKFNMLLKRKAKIIDSSIVNTDVTNTAQKYLFWNNSSAENINLCKHQLDSMEHWARRLIDESFKTAYGNDYFEYRFPNEMPLVKKEIYNRVSRRMASNPYRFPRKIDAIEVGDLAYFFCRDDLYREHFKNIFEPFYTSAEEVRNLIMKIGDIRNKISHANPISIREVEQCVCYTNDLIDVFKNYYTQKGSEKEYNVPMILSFKDSFGNYVIRDPLVDYNWLVFSNHLNGESKPIERVQLRCGETYRIELEVDASFPKDFYIIYWNVSCGINDRLAHGKGNIIEFTVDEACVSSNPKINVKLVTQRKWHKFGNVKADDLLDIHLATVLPPIEDTY